MNELDRWLMMRVDIEADIALLRRQRAKKAAKESAPISLSTPFAPVSTRGNEFSRQISELKLRLIQVNNIIKRMEEET